MSFGRARAAILGQRLGRFKATAEAKYANEQDLIRFVQA
jgi:hypothetical protein